MHPCILDIVLDILLTLFLLHNVIVEDMGKRDEL